MGEPKAKKIRLFQPIWTENYGCIESGDRVVCCLYGDTITGRTYNIERHFSSKHKAISEMPNDEKLENIKKHVLNFGNQKGVLQKFITKHHHSTTASFAAALAIARRGKPFSDGEYLKTAFIQCSEHLFNDFKNKKEILARIQELPLSARSVQRRIKDMAEDIDVQVK
jgi:hypothetical protein